MQKGHTETNANQIQELRTESVKKKSKKSKNQKQPTLYNIHRYINFPRDQSVLWLKNQQRLIKKRYNRLWQRY